MAILIKILMLMVIGLAAGIGYNAWPVLSDGLLIGASRGVPGRDQIEMVSYAVGLAGGMLLWQIASVPWSALPTKLHSYLLSQMHFYQFVIMGGACLLVLLYF